MGIQGLLPVLRPYMRASHVKEFAGKRIACDGYSWLHKGVYSCALLVATGQTPWREQGRRSPYVQFCLNRMRMMRSHGVDPILVFDGDRLPAKSGTELERRARRRERLGRAQELLAQGDAQAAELIFQSAIDVTPYMAYEVICALREEGFEYVVAPYEADAQLAFLARSGQVAAVATEDSDLAAYLAPAILFKMDAAGAALCLRMEDVFAGRLAEDDDGGGGGGEGCGSGSGEGNRSGGGAGGGGGGGDGGGRDSEVEIVGEVFAGAAGRGRGGAAADENRAPRGAEGSGAGCGGGAGPGARARAGGAGAEGEGAAGADGESEPEEIEEIIDEPRPRRGEGPSAASRRRSGGSAGGAREVRPAAPGADGGRASALSFRKFSPGLFLAMCVLAGCDFLPNIPGIGIKKAHALALKSRIPERLPHLLRGNNKIKLPEGYIASFRRAISTFKHARVYDKETGALRHLEEVPESGQGAADVAADSSFLGPDLPAEVARKIAEGRIDPISRQPFPPLPAASPAPPVTTYESLYGAGRPRAPDGPFVCVGGGGRGGGGGGGWGRGSGGGGGGGGQLGWNGARGQHHSHHGQHHHHGGGGGGGGHAELPDWDRGLWEPDSGDGDADAGGQPDEAALRETQRKGGEACQQLAQQLGLGGRGAAHTGGLRLPAPERLRQTEDEIRSTYQGGALGLYEGFRGPGGAAAEGRGAAGGAARGPGGWSAMVADDDAFFDDPAVIEASDALVASRARGSPRALSPGQAGRAARSPPGGVGGAGRLGGEAGPKRKAPEAQRGDGDDDVPEGPVGGGWDEDELDFLGEQPQPTPPPQRASPRAQTQHHARDGRAAHSHGASPAAGRGGSDGDGDGAGAGGAQKAPGPRGGTNIFARKANDAARSRVSGWLAPPVTKLPQEPNRPRPVVPGTMALDEEMGFVGSSGKKRRAAAAGTPAVVIPVAAAKASALAVPGGIASRGAEPAASRPAQLAKPSPLAPAGPSAAAARGSGKAGQSSAAKGKSKQKGPPPGMTTLTRFFGPAAS